MLGITSVGAITHPSCGACGRPVEARSACRTFKTYHARCIEKLVEVSRELHGIEA